MNSIHAKEKKLNEALEKLNSINPQNLNLKETVIEYLIIGLIAYYIFF